METLRSCLRLVFKITIDIFPATNSGVRSGGTGFATQSTQSISQSTLSVLLVKSWLCAFFV
ncbi:MAG: hypothetical protein QM763_23540 [Agriterribacter sp.]